MIDILNSVSFHVLARSGLNGDLHIKGYVVELENAMALTVTRHDLYRISCRLYLRFSISVIKTGYYLYYSAPSKKTIRGYLAQVNNYYAKNHYLNVISHQDFVFSLE